MSCTPRPISSLPVIVVLDDIAVDWITALLPDLTGIAEVVCFENDLEAASYVSLNAARIRAFIQDINRPDATGRIVPAGLAFFHQVIDSFTPDARVVFNSGYMHSYIESGSLPPQVRDRFRFFAKPEGYGQLAEVVEWMLARPPKDSKPVSAELSVITPAWDEICRYVANHPDILHRLNARRFEELIAELFRSHGWEVDLTANTRDGGFDIVAIRRTFPTSIQTLIEVKRCDPTRPIGVSVVRALYGIQARNPTSQLVLATSSYVSRDAKREFSRSIPWEIDFLERDRILEWCSSYRTATFDGTISKPA